MKTLVVLVIITVFLFSGSVATLILGVIRKKKPLKWISLILFITFLIMATWTSSLIISKTCNDTTL